MIVVKAPLRISLFGGGTDFPNFYQRGHLGNDERPWGAVLSTTIDKYLYITVKRRFDEKICVNWREPEMVDTVAEIRHELVREAMALLEMAPGIEISTMADVPSRGCGLGSSSALTVGLLKAFGAYLNLTATYDHLADAACFIEIEKLGKPIGKQDQYIAAYGGMNHIVFRPDYIAPNPILASEKRLRQLNDRLMLFYTGVTRQASDILTRQVERRVDNIPTLCRMRQQALDAANLLEDETQDLDTLGRMLNQAWEWKRQLASGIGNWEIARMNHIALEAGALGGKICGAGGGGFLLLYVPLEKQEAVTDALVDYRELPFRFDPVGTRVIFDGR